MQYSLQKLVSLLTLLMLSPTAFSAVILSGDIVLSAPPPASADHGQLESSDHAFFWQEQQNVVVTESFFVTALPFQNNPTGDYDSGNAAIEATWGVTWAPVLTIVIIFMRINKAPMSPLPAL
ncbi:hypothetical protein [Oceanicoccus sagamiensis]|uniref:Uncharacterized protein n=1 Tax=Oceanicoccus sagamiensis TaxID=716816 RepID=A0A1X9N897_9GAMM|nr:hypothetical protein [Oceanicoccus sagamiensis]ARN73906.1 hypothetical protein BST96_07125 [Oceanicoccus sagamiensis]